MLLSAARSLLQDGVSRHASARDQVQGTHMRKRGKYESLACM